VRFDGITEVAAASRLVGCEVWISPGDVSFPAGEDEHPAALVGMSVRDARLGEIGVVEDFFATAAHGILVVQGEYGEVLLPNVPGFKKMVDWKERRLLVELPEGLVDNGR
jgi:16S rRNA processing protein RimM